MSENADVLEFPHICPTTGCRPCLERNLADIDAQIAAIREVNASPVYCQFRGIDFTPTDLAADSPELPWLVQDLVGEGMRTLLVSPAGVGKTWLALGISLAVAANHPFAGFQVENLALRPVVFLDEENPVSTVRSRIHSLAYGMGLKSKDYIGGLLHHSQRAFHRSHKGLPALKDYLHEVNPCLLVLDTARRFLVGDENDSAPVADFWTWLDGLRAATSSPCAALVLHHTGHEAARARGSSDWLASPDVILQLSGSPETALRLAWSKVRHGQPRPAETLSFRREGQSVRFESASF